MKAVLFDLIVGLGLGALYAMLGAGLVVVHKGSGVINFAHGAMAMYTVATFDSVWHEGRLFLPWVDIAPTKQLNLPVRIDLVGKGGVPMGVAMIIALAMAALLGLAAHFMVFRLLRNAAPLGRVVGSLGLALYLQGVALLNFGTSNRTPKTIYPDRRFENFLGLGKTMPLNTVMAVVAAVVFGVIVWLIYQHTRFGVATRASAANEKGAVLLGLSPQSLAARNWLMASVLAGLAAILVGPIQGSITAGGLTAMVVPALAAALIGNLSSVPVAMLGGFGLGALQTLLNLHRDSWFSWTHMRDGVIQTLPLLVIVVVLFTRGRSLPIRGLVEEKRLPRSPVPRRGYQHAFFWSVVAITLAYVFQNSGKRTVFAGAIQTSIVFMILALSITVLTGYTGQISLMQMSMAGAAAFFMARMLANGSATGAGLTSVSGPGLPWPIAALLGVMVAVIVGVVLGLPATRIRGVQLAVVTIAAAVAIQSIYFDNGQFTGLISGSPADIKRPTFFGIDIGARSQRVQNDRPMFIVFELVVFVALALAVSHLRVSATGRRFFAIRANERAAAAAGVNVTRSKLLAFAISSAIAGVGGIMLAFKQVQVSSGNFPYTASLTLLAFAYLGGLTSINGAVITGLIMVGGLVPVFSNYFYAKSIDKYLGVIGGLGMIVTAIIHPEGVAPFFAAAIRHAGNWFVESVPGMATIRDAYAGRHRRGLSVLLAVLVVGGALWLYHLDDKIVKNNLAWIALTAVLLWAILFAVSVRLGGPSPTFAQAGARWAGFVRRFGATIVAGYVAGWLIWPQREDRYSKLYLPIVGAGLALMIRSIAMQIYRARTGKPNPMQAALEPAH